MDLNMYNDEQECYLSHDVLKKAFCDNNILRRNDEYLVKFNDIIERKFKTLMYTKSVVRDRSNNESYAAVIVKALIMDKPNKTIYLVDEKINSGKDKISILGGHVEPNDLFESPDNSIRDYLKSELVREMCEELTTNGYVNYAIMSKEETCDVVNMMKKLQLYVREDSIWYCHYSDTAFTIYIPYIVESHTLDSLNGAMIEYPYTQHKSLRSLLADGRHGKKVAQYLFDLAKYDARVETPEYLDAIFNTMLGK